MRKFFLILCIAIVLCGCNLSGGESIVVYEPGSRSESVSSSVQSEFISLPIPTLPENSEQASTPTRVPGAVSASEEASFSQTSASSENKHTSPDNANIYSTGPNNSEPPQSVSKNVCTLSIECSAVFDNLNALEKGKEEILPTNGVVFAAASVEFFEGESVFDLLKRVCKDNRIHMESSWTPLYNSAYIEGINNLYEFDCGSGSGWMYRVNGVYPNCGCSRYMLKRGDVVEWRYTCDLGKDIGGDVLGG